MHPRRRRVGDRRRSRRTGGRRPRGRPQPTAPSSARRSPGPSARWRRAGPGPRTHEGGRARRRASAGRRSIRPVRARPGGLPKAGAPDRWSAARRRPNCSAICVVGRPSRTRCIPSVVAVTSSTAGTGGPPGTRIHRRPAASVARKRAASPPARRFQWTSDTSASSQALRRTRRRDPASPPGGMEDARVTEPLEFDPIPDIRLIACDMDGTLLDDDDAIHDDFWPLIDQLHERGIIFCPASGAAVLQPAGALQADCRRGDLHRRERHLRRCARAASSARTAWIGIVARELIRVDPGSQRARSRRRRRAVRQGARPTSSARDPAFLAEVVKYYHRLDRSSRISLAIEDDILKVAVYDFASSERISAPAFAPLSRHPPGGRFGASTGWTSWPHRRTRDRASATSRRRCGSPGTRRWSSGTFSTTWR